MRREVSVAGHDLDLGPSRTATCPGRVSDGPSRSALGLCSSPDVGQCTYSVTRPPQTGRTAVDAKGRRE